ncbi:hypothetical protein [Corynebacterium auriscanis]|nr:hypothetical protein [Corynebacterium auriscanis]WJY73255.1 hypothetical protein CAURIC_08210 [Corynebacterium auriscanis]
MSWMTKDLTLKLLEIAITGLVEAHDTIKATQPQPEKPAPAQPPAPAQAPTDPTRTPPEEDDIPEPTPTMPDIQTALRTIAQAEGVDWIQNTLFPTLNITNITTLPTNNIPQAWDLIQTHLTEIQLAQ